MSVRISGSGFDDTNIVIGELEMRLRRPYLLHMAGNAVLRTYFAAKRQALSARHRCGPGFREPGMARQTLGVIVSNILFDRLVRIVACRATDSSIIRVALAVENSIRLKPYVVDLQASHLLKVASAAMTSRTKLLG